MRRVLAGFVAGVRRRSTGAASKRRTYRAQFGSSVVFMTAGVLSWSDLPWIATLLWLEALGQFLLARGEQASAKQGDEEVVYFRRTLRGGAAAFVFGLVSLTRCVLADDAAGTQGWITGLGLVTMMLFLAVASTSSVRLDAPMGAMIASFAVVLGVALAVGGSGPLAGAQFAYVAVLFIGVTALEPWQAEVVNIPVFASVALLSSVG